MEKKITIKASDITNNIEKDFIDLAIDRVKNDYKAEEYPISKAGKKQILKALEEAKKAFCPQEQSTKENRTMKKTVKIVKEVFIDEEFCKQLEVDEQKQQEFIAEVLKQYGTERFVLDFN